MRRIIEFYCTECQTYFDIKLNTSLNGSRRVHCPKCKHIHYRKVEDGKITDTRFNERDPNDILIEDICPMPSSCRDHQKETVLTTEGNLSSESFMRRLWFDIFNVAT